MCYEKIKRHRDKKGSESYQKSINPKNRMSQYIREAYEHTERKGHPQIA